MIKIKIYWSKYLLKFEKGYRCVCFLKKILALKKSHTFIKVIIVVLLLLLWKFKMFLLILMSGYLDIIIQKHRLMIALKAKFYAFCYKTNSYLMFIKSPKQSLGDLLFLLRFLLLLLLLLLFFLSVHQELVHGRSQELQDRISWNLVEL